MKLLIALTLIMSCVLGTHNLSAKEFVVLTEHTIRIPEGGSLDEALRLSHEWRDKVLKKMPQIARISYLHRTTEESNVHKLMVIYEYAPVPEGQQSLPVNEAIELGFPDEQVRQTFFADLGRYINRQENVSHQFARVD